jgi:hypothetical protein
MIAGPESRTDPPGAKELAGLLAHDLRTPLNAVRGFADLLLAGAAGPLAPAQVDLVVEIARAGRALEAAVGAAQELGEPLPRRHAPSEPARLDMLLREAGFTFRTDPGLQGAAATVVAEPGVWRRLLAACHVHCRGDRASPALAALQSGQDGSLELLMEHTDICERWQTSTLRERSILRLAAAAGAAVVSTTPHVPLALRLGRGAARCAAATGGS